jgi:anti-anti-sigma factor
MMEISTAHEGGVFVYTVAGRFDAQTCHEVEQQMRVWLEAGEIRLLGDFSKLDYISSAGLRVLLMMAKELAKRGGRIGLYSLKENVKEVFDIAGISSIIPISSSKEEALKAMAS